MTMELLVLLWEAHPPPLPHATHAPAAPLAKTRKAELKHFVEENITENLRVVS